MTEPSSSLKQTVRERAQGCCEYCWSQEKFATQSFSIEHIYPLSKGGQTSLENLALACQGCNNYKYNKTQGKDPVNQELVSLYHPRQQQWQEHFAWNEDYTLIVGLSPTGRTTVTELRLNRAGLVNLRQILYTMGEHPPNR
ncbi:MAG: HNH endonuclease [Spirulinaceae cyanobacterium]